MRAGPILLLAAVVSAGCSGLAVQRGLYERTIYLDEVGTSLGMASGSVGERSGPASIAGEIFGQENIVGPEYGFSLRAGLMYDTIGLTKQQLDSPVPAGWGGYVGWYLMPVGWYALVPEVVYVRAGVGGISGDVKISEGSKNLAEHAMGLRGMLGIHVRLVEYQGLSYRLYLDCMGTTTRDTPIGSYEGVALVGGLLFAFTP